MLDRLFSLWWIHSQVIIHWYLLTRWWRFQVTLESRGDGSWTRKVLSFHISVYTLHHHNRPGYRAEFSRLGSRCLMLLVCASHVLRSFIWFFHDVKVVSSMEQRWFFCLRFLPGSWLFRSLMLKIINCIIRSSIPIHQNVRCSGINLSSSNCIIRRQQRILTVTGSLVTDFNLIQPSPVHKL